MLQRPLARIDAAIAGGTFVRLLAFAVFGFVLHRGVFAHAGQLNMFRDAQYLNAYEQNAARIVAQFGQLPLWDPYSCGGMYLLGNPQARAFAPPVLLSVALGATKAIPLTSWLLFVLGAEGAFRFLFARAGSAIGAALGALIFCSSGHLAVSQSHGWIQFYGFLLIPWILHGVHLTLEGKPRGILLAAGGMAFVIGFGGGYPGPLAALLVAIETLRALRPSQLKRQGLLLLLLGIAMISLCLFRLWPIVEELASSPRIMAGRPSHTNRALFEMILKPATPDGSELPLPGQFFVGHAACLTLATLGLLRRRGWVAFGAMVVCTMLAAGYTRAAFPLLRELPLYSTLRYPERFLWLGTLYLGELVAHAFCLIRRMPSVPRLLVLSSALVAGGIALGAEVKNFATVTAATAYAAPAPEQRAEFRQARGNRWLMSYFGPLSMGSLSCGEAYPVRMSPRLETGLAAEEYLAEPSAGTVRRLAWTPERIELAVELTKPTRVLVNQNWHPGWRASAGTVVNHEELLGVELPAGHQRLSLAFQPRSGIGGLACSMAALLGLGIAAMALRHRSLLVGRFPRWLMFCVVAPLALPCLAVAALPNPRVPRAPTNVAGEKLIVDEVPNDATALDVAFDLPVQFVGVRLREPDSLGVATGNLFVVVRGAVPKDVGVFLHARDGAGGYVNLDREVIGGTYFLKHSPRDVVLADSFALDTSALKKGRWTLYGGLWNAKKAERPLVLRGNSTPNGVPLGSFVVR